MSSNDFLFYLEVLKSEECQCGYTKRRAMAFCYKCYDSLPKDMKKALWQTLRNGFEEAYDDAVRWLNE